MSDERSELADAVADVLVRAGDAHQAASDLADKYGGDLGNSDWPAEIESWRDRVLKAYGRYVRGEATAADVRTEVDNDWIGALMDWWREEMGRAI